MAMNINPVSGQNPAQGYLNIQTDAPRSTQQDSNQGATNASTKVDISQRARELQAQRLRDQQETKEAERTADNEQTEPAIALRRQATDANSQLQETANSQNTINVMA